MKSYCPFSRLSIHHQPSIVSIVVLFRHVNTISFAFYRLVVGPSSTGLDMFFLVKKLDISALVKVFKTQMKLLEKRVNLILLVQSRPSVNNLQKRISIISDPLDYNGSFRNRGNVYLFRTDASLSRHSIFVVSTKTVKFIWVIEVHE